ncbi:MAG: LamG-like jellyroll fold domain-containing protein, partial [Pseudomonadota bacterium]|nr:LamG-like jellyroll fold domain-containing protein [Pseudomonadota bacterium]
MKETVLPYSLIKTLPQLLCFLTILLLSSHVHAQNCGAPTTDGLVGYWTLDEASGTFADSSGNGFTGTQSGGVGYGAAGVVDDAATFDGNDDFITTSTSATLDPAVVTACAWVNRTGEGSGENWQEVIGNGNFQNYGWNLNLEPEATNATFFVNRSGARDSATVAIETTLGWHHYCGVFDGTYAHVYVDGKLGGTSVATS